MLKALAATSALPVVTGAVAAGGDDDRGGDDSDDDSRDDGGDARPPTIHPQFGYSGTGDETVPQRFSPDATVGLHVDEERIDDSNLPTLTVEFGAFHFDPVGLQVEPGAIVEFDFVTPEHTVTAYHLGQERQQRVPSDVAPFSSGVNAHGGFWLYRFETAGVYDVFCAPHEWGGMAMRIVVGDETEPVVRQQGRPPLPMSAALVGTGMPPEGGGDPDVGHPSLVPGNIVDNGPIAAEDVDIDLAVTITGPTPA